MADTIALPVRRVTKGGSVKGKLAGSTYSLLLVSHLSCIFRSFNPLRLTNVLFILPQLKKFDGIF